tara:strand:+ start:191 stop:607 length:417 start_codon:yes stop_codon:yes gene_type:complete
MELQSLPLKLKSQNDITNLHNDKICKVGVNYLIYNNKKKTIICKGNSKPSGISNTKSSIHAEEIAMKYCIHNDHKDKYIIFIWRWNRSGKILPKFSCSRCTKLAKKLSFENRIFTFENNSIINAIIDSPNKSLGYIMN